MLIEKIRRVRTTNYLSIQLSIFGISFKFLWNSKRIFISFLDFLISLKKLIVQYSLELIIVLLIIHLWVDYAECMLTILNKKMD